jgi:hypothetical protein
MPRMRPSRQLAPLPAARTGSPTAGWLLRWQNLSPLARDITLILIVKAIVLGLLWFAFFRSPAAPRMAMDPQRVEQNLLAPAAPVPAPSLEPPHAVR